MCRTLPCVHARRFCGTGRQGDTLASPVVGGCKTATIARRQQPAQGGLAHGNNAMRPQQLRERAGVACGHTRKAQGTGWCAKKNKKRAQKREKLCTLQEGVQRGGVMPKRDPTRVFLCNASLCSCRTQAWRAHDNGKQPRTTGEEEEEERHTCSRAEMRGSPTDASPSSHSPCVAQRMRATRTKRAHGRGAVKKVGRSTVGRNTKTNCRQDMKNLCALAGGGLAAFFSRCE